MATTKITRVTVAGVLASATVITAVAVTGALLGLLFVALFVPKTGMGWDQMADALGGLMVGGVLGVVVGIVLAVALDVRRKLIAAGVCILIAGLAIGALIGHYIMGFELSIMSMMGIVALSGVIVNDSLILLQNF